MSAYIEYVNPGETQYFEYKYSSKEWDSEVDENNMPKYTWKRDMYFDCTLKCDIGPYKKGHFFEIIAFRFLESIARFYEPFSDFPNYKCKIF